MKLKMYNNNKKIRIGKYEINVYTDWDWCRFYIGCLFCRGFVLCIGFFLIHVDICDIYKAFAQEKNRSFNRKGQQMITIDQLLESVDLSFEPRWITKDSNGIISIFAERPERRSTVWDSCKKMQIFGKIKLTEFDGKIWTECIYKVSRKTTGKIEKIFIPETDVCADSAEYSIELAKRLNQVIDAVNEINENYACIAALTDIRKRLDTLEKCVENQRGE